MKIIRMNLPRHQARKDFGNGALVAMGVPYDDIIIWEGKDNLPYEKTYQLYEDALKDGFPHFQGMLDNYVDEWMSIAHASQHWNWCRILRYIATEHGEPAIVLLDDIFFAKPIFEILGLYRHACEMAVADGTPLKFLAYNYHADAEPVLVNSDAKRIPPHFLLFRGIPANAVDAACLLTPEGADWLLAEWMRVGVEYGAYTGVLEELFVRVFPKYEDVDMVSGIYCVGTPDYIRFMPKEVAPSTICVETKAGTDFDAYLRPVEDTRREKS